MQTRVSFDTKKNALNTLKVIAAFQVAYLHAIAHLGVTVPAAISEIINVFMGVPIFFMLSGFLIWNSLDKSSDFLGYAKKRVIRIFPELWLGVAIEIILLIVFLKDKINWLMLGIFAVCQGTVLQFYTPDSLRDFGCGTPNGALWTLGITIQFYIIVWFVHRFLKNKNIYWWSGIILASIVVKAVSPLIISALPVTVGKLYNQTIIPYFWMFIIGAFLAHYKDVAIPFLKKTWWIFFALSFVVSIFKIDIGIESYGVFLYSLRVPGLIGLCYNIPKFNIPLDFSYGLFIYHMLVINLMLELGFSGKVYHLIIALSASILLACLSTLFGRFVNNFINNKKSERKNANKT